MCDTTPDSCKRCCRMNLNTSCFVMQPEEMLPDGNSTPIYSSKQESNKKIRAYEWAFAR